MVMRIVGISDVSVGYGSPQILAMMNSLLDRYDNATATIIEPDQPAIEPWYSEDHRLHVKRINTAFDPYSDMGRREYIIESTKRTNVIEPDILVIFCTFTLPVLFKLKKRPKLTIYYQIEFAPAYGELDIKMNRICEDLIDIVIYPEENRARMDMEVCGYKDIPNIYMYNASRAKNEIDIIPASTRNGRILYQGAINQHLTQAEYYLKNERYPLDIDLYGNISGEGKEDIERRLTNGRNNINFFGFVDSKSLSILRKQYAYSIVMWNPIQDNYLYACPNKFFESIYDGVPPITAPHPQCKSLVDQYECGIVMKDWSYESFRTSLIKAQEMYGTSQYDRMVDNCKYAAEVELNWDHQFNKLSSFLDTYKGLKLHASGAFGGWFRNKTRGNYETNA